MRNGIIIFSLFAALLFGCQAEENPELHLAEHISSLSMNEGAKWKTDAGTRMHVVALQELTNGFKESTALSDYHQLAASLQTELNMLVKECRMDGPEHEALHLWLEPVVEDVKSLSSLTDVGSGKATLQKLNQDLQLFNQYFY
ncbi:MAG: hypothetical protein JST06_00055 [Bacteroidetes bacterium]|nr:hypothetical protein [Bacteroidota bacterium]MBS1629462.1 hypothetical protein [Bacteroidota bacterium]